MTLLKAQPSLLWDDVPQMADVDAVRGLVHATGVFSPEEIRVAGDLVEGTVQEEDDYTFVFARIHGSKRLAGYACFAEIPLTEGRYDLYWIAVNPQMYGQDIGAQLLRKVEQRVRGSGGYAIYAETSGRTDYEPARKFYLKNGFIEAANIPDFYRKNDAKIIYSKKL